MLGFLIKKSFYDLWDNMFRIALLNLGFIASAAIPVFLPQLCMSVPALGIAVLAVGVLWCFIYLAAAALCVRTISGGDSVLGKNERFMTAFSFADFGRALKAGLSAGLTLGATAFLAILMVTLVIPFYAQINSLLGIFLAAMIFWVLVALVLSLQFFLAARARLAEKPLTALRKSFVIFLDNPGFSIFVFICALLQSALSILLALLMPGPAGILLFLDEALRLRLLKYDWLEEHPDADRKHIPWDALLIDERERTGSRSLRNFIFPWKD